MDKRDQVATYTEVNRVALRDGYAPLLRVWYWQRHQDRGGKGWFWKNDFIQNIIDLGLTPKRAKQITKDGMDIFWWESGDVIRFIGLGKLGDTLNIEKNEGFRVFIPAEAFADLQTFKAYAYASWFARASWRSFDVDDDRNVTPAGGKTISRVALQKAFGITRQTQSTYEDITGMWVEKQLAAFKVNMVSDAEYITFTENTLNGNQGGMWLADVDGDGKEELVRQMPNRYSTQLEVIGHRKRIKSGGSSNNRGADPNHEFNRSYFDDRYEAVKAVADGNTREGIAYVRTTQQLESGGTRFRVYRTIY